MKKIRIETKSGELVKEFDGQIKNGYIQSALSTYWSGDIEALDLIVKEIEVEEKKPVVRWLWIFLDHQDGTRYVCSKQYFTQEEASKYFGALLVRKIENSSQEFES